MKGLLLDQATAEHYMVESALQGSSDFLVSSVDKTVYQLGPETSW